MLYCVEAVPLDLTKIERTRNWAAKKLLGAYSSDDGAAARGFLGWPDVEVLAALRIVGFVLRLMAHPWPPMRAHLHRLLITEDDDHFDSRWRKSVLDGLDVLGLDRDRFIATVGNYHVGGEAQADDEYLPVVLETVKKRKEANRDSAHPLSQVGRGARFSFPFYRGHLHPRDYFHGVRRTAHPCCFCGAMVPHLDEPIHLLVECVHPDVVLVRGQFEAAIQAGRQAGPLRSVSLLVMMDYVARPAGEAAMLFFQDKEYGRDRKSFANHWHSKWWKVHASSYRAWKQDGGAAAAAAAAAVAAAVAPAAAAPVAAAAMDNVG